MILTEKRLERFKGVASSRLGDCVVLENIHDPHNALAAFRNCDAFGIQTVHIIFETEKIFSPTALGKATSSSANKWVDTVCWKTSQECFRSLKADGFQLTATVIDPKAKKLTEMQFPKQKIALIFGNEGFGISATAKTSADELMYIPMSGFVDSLNLSVSVGVVLYELYKQRYLGKHKILSEKSVAELIDRWVSREQRRKR